MQPSDSTATSGLLGDAATHRQLNALKRDYYEVLLENTRLHEQNHQLSATLGVAMARLSQLGIRLEPPFDISHTMRRARERQRAAETEALQAGKALPLLQDAARGVGDKTRGGRDGHADGRDGTAMGITRPQSRFRCVANLKEHTGHVQTAAFAPFIGEDGGSGTALAFLATGGFDSRIVLWRIAASQVSSSAGGGGEMASATGGVNPQGGSAGAGGRVASISTTIAAHTKNVSGVAWFPGDGGHLVSSSFDGTCRVWDLRSAAAASPSSPVQTTAAALHVFSPPAGGGYMLTCCTLDTRSYACADTRRHTYIVDSRVPADRAPALSWAHPQPLTSLCADPNNPHLLVTGYTDGVVRLWDIRAVQQQRSQSSGAGGVRNRSLSAAGTGDQGSGVTVGSDPATPARLSHSNNGSVFNGGAMADGAVDMSPVSADSPERGGAPDFTALSSAAGGATTTSNSGSAGILCEWAVDASLTPVWHLALVPRSTPDHLARRVNQQLLCISEDGMARLYNAQLPAIDAPLPPLPPPLHADAATTAAGDMRTPTGSDRYAAKLFTLRTVVPGIQARGVPIRGSVWAGSHLHRDARQSNLVGADDEDDDDDLAATDAPQTSRRQKNAPLVPTRRVDASDLLVVGSTSGVAHVYDVTDAEDPKLVERLEGHKSIVSGAAVLQPTNAWQRPLFATYSNDCVVRLWTSN